MRRRGRVVSRVVRASCGCAAVALVACVGDPLASALAVTDSTGGPSSAALPALNLTAVPAPQWSALFDRQHGWTGGDAISSIPLSGVEAPGTATQTMFLFNDSAIGDVLPDNSRSPNTVLVNNTVAGLAGPIPDTSRTRFYWTTLPNGKAAPVFVPSTPNAVAGDQLWNLDGFAQHGQVYGFFMLMRDTGSGGPFSFQIQGITIVTFPTSARPPFHETQIETPVFRAPAGNRGKMYFGSGVLPNTVAARAPSPDGYVYIYGCEDLPTNARWLLAARVPESQFTNFGAWTFWNGSTWVPGIANAARIISRVSNELSVTPLADGTFLLVYMRDTISPNVTVRVGPTPVGPWGPAQIVYVAPEMGPDPDIFTYNAKGHPHLSSPGELLVSYNVNTFDFFGDFFRDADIYRPRFIRVLGLP